MAKNTQRILEEQSHGDDVSGVMIKIRKAAKEDQAEFAQVDAEAAATLRKVYRPNARALANRARMKKRLLRIVAEMDGRIVGTAEYAHEEGRLRIVNLGVREDCRRKGVARALIEELASIARASGVPCLLTHTVKETGNVQFFKKLRFEVVAESHDNYAQSDSHPQLTDVELVRYVRTAEDP